MKLKNKLLIVLMVLIISIISISTISLAKYTPGKFGDAISSADVDATEIKNIGGQIVGIIQIVGTIVSTGMMMILGIKYMIGSAEEKAAYKKTLFPYFIGAVLIFGASNLTQVIYTWARNI